MAWGLWGTCPRWWGKLWLNYCCFTCRVDGVQLASTAGVEVRSRTPRANPTVHCCWPTRTGHRYIRYRTPVRRLPRICAQLASYGAAKAAAFSAERQSRRAPAATTRRAVEGTREAVRTSVQHQAQASARTRAAPLGAAPKQPPWPAPSLVMREDCRTPISVMIDENRAYDGSQ